MRAGPFSCLAIDGVRVAVHHKLMAPSFRFTVAPARGDADLARAKDLFLAYAASLDTDLAYQGFALELAGLPGLYAPPAGELLLATNALGLPIGVVALRPLKLTGCCEMKRLYVAPAGRGLGLGAALVDAITDVARAIGYRELRLDTLPTMHAALRLYRRLGFVETDPYYDTPVAGTVFLCKLLADGDRR